MISHLSKKALIAVALVAVSSSAFCPTSKTISSCSSRSPDGSKTALSRSRSVSFKSKIRTSSIRDLAAATNFDDKSSSVLSNEEKPVRRVRSVSFKSKIRTSSIRDLAAATNFDDKSSSVLSNEEKPVRRVAIIGAGIAGLSLAHAIQNIASVDDTTPIEVSVFESRTELVFEGDGVGAGIQLNGGAAMLHKIDPKLHAKVEKAGLPLVNIRSRAKPWVQKSPPISPEDSFSTLLEINLEKAIRQAGGETADALIIDGKVQAFSIMRSSLQKILYEELDAAPVSLGKSLTGITSANDGNGAMCSFADGSSYGPFDLICGCDGVSSSVKEYIGRRKITADKTAKRSAIYSGIRIRYAVEGDGQGEEIGETSELRQYFGDGTYGLYGTYGAGEGKRKRAGYLIYRDDDYIGPFKKKDSSSAAARVEENVDWKETRSNEMNMKDDSIQKMTVAGLPQFELRPVIEKSEHFFELGVYFHNPFSFFGWTREVEGAKNTFCVVAGDSAHAMPPFLGQGANQACVDAYSLASKIAQHNNNCRKQQSSESIVLESSDAVPSLKELLGEYEKRRWGATSSITLKSLFLGYLETGGQGFPSKLRDVIFRVLGKVGIATKVFLDGATPKV